MEFLMTRNDLYISFTILSILMTPPAFAQAPAAIVRIESDVLHGTATGTASIMKNGEIITCYHVVEGATRIAVTIDHKRYEDIIVSRVSPEYDLAVLNVTGLPASIAGLEMADITPSQFAGRPLDTWGYPQMTDQQHFYIETNKPTWQASGLLMSQGGAYHLFAKPNVDLIALTMVTYNGMSGAPVLFGGRIIGLISGSYAEGANITWAIPVKYFRDAVLVNRRPKDISAWPKLTLMGNAFGVQRRDLSGNARYLAAYRAYQSVSKEVIANIPDIDAEKRNGAQDVQAMEQAVHRAIARYGKDAPVTRDQVVMSYLKKAMDSTCECDPNSTYGQAAAAAKEIAEQLNPYQKELFDRLSESQQDFIQEHADDMLQKAMSSSSQATQDWFDAMGDLNDLGPLSEESTLGDFEERITTGKELIKATSRKQMIETATILFNIESYTFEQVLRFNGIPIH
jgi:hypothetical protein